MYRIPYRKKTNSYHRYKDQQHIREVYTDRIGIDYETASGTQSYNAETLLKKAEQQSRKDTGKRTEHGLSLIHI